MGLFSQLIVRSLTKPSNAGFRTCTAVFAKNDISKITEVKEAPIVDSSMVVVDPNEIKHQKKLSEFISVPEEVNLSPISGVPSEQVRTRRVRIYVPSKNAMQSGTNSYNHWEIEFDNRERWENPLMGWSSTADPLSNMKVDFHTKEDAIKYCDKNGWTWFIDGEEKPYKLRNKNYGLNFSWNKRTRVSTK